MPDRAGRPSIPRFFLYGELPAEVERDFLHVEPINRRSSINEWTIRPHAHPDHLQLLLVTRGGGSISIEAATWTIMPPALIVVPAGLVHAIEFTPGTDGIVVTVATAYAATLVHGDPVLAATLARPLCQRLGQQPAEAAEESDPVGAAFDALAREFVWAAPGRRAAIGAHLTCMLVRIARLEAAAGHDATLPAPGRNLDLVHRFRELVEHHFREALPISLYADKLNVTHARLNTACRDVTGGSATKILFDRMIIEAKRLLLYSGLSVSEIASAVGFSDAAYFCRFFTKRAGIAPRYFREVNRPGEPRDPHARGH